MPMFKLPSFITPGANGGLTVEVINYDKVVEALAALGPQVLAAAEYAATEEAIYELGLTQKFVPVATGALLATGRVEDVETGEGEIVKGIAYGDDAEVDYALAVHENVFVDHKPPTKAKYVEDVVREELASGEAAGRMVDTMREIAKWM